MIKLAISSIGKDQSGIVGAFTKVLYDYECNIEDASMTILCNQFSMILVITGPDNLNIDNFKNTLMEAGKSFALRTTINELDNNSCDCKDCCESLPYMICVSGNDRKGIAYKITELLAKYKINIADFNSKLIGKSTKPVYVMMLETEIPATIDIDDLKKELNTIAEEMDLDINLNEIECCDL
ncbi:MAG: glycine cleavage system protein R [Vampirovibrionia bacterium]